MDELEWLRKNSPPTAPSRDVTQRHRTQLRAAIASEGVDGTPPRRPRRRLRSRHRVIVTTGVVLVLCAAGAGVVALTSNGGDDGRRVGAPAASGGASTTTPPTCTGPLPADFPIPSDFGSGVTGPAKESSDPVEPGQQVTHRSSGTATFEIRWPASAQVQKQFGVVLEPQRPDDRSSSATSDLRETVDGNGVVHRRTVITFPGQVPACQAVEVTVYGTDAALVNALANAFNVAKYPSNEPLVTTTQAAAAVPQVTPCPGPVDANGTPIKLADVKYVPTVSGVASRGVFARPDDALADFVTSAGHFITRGYEAYQLPDGSISYAAEARPGAVVTVVHVGATNDGWTVEDWSASGC